MGISSGAGTANPSKEPENTPSGVCVARSLAFCGVFCRSLFDQYHEYGIKRHSKNVFILCIYYKL
jgi:hypothetical protein